MLLLLPGTPFLSSLFHPSPTLHLIPSRFSDLGFSGPSWTTSSKLVLLRLSTFVCCLSKLARSIVICFCLSVSCLSSPLDHTFPEAEALTSGSVLGTMFGQ